MGPFLPIVIGTSWIFSFWKPMSWETSAEKFLELFLQWFLPISFWKSCWDFRLPGLILFHFSSFSTLEKSICLFAFLSWRWSQLFHRFLIFSFQDLFLILYFFLKASYASFMDTVTSHIFLRCDKSRYLACVLEVSSLYIVSISSNLLFLYLLW